MPALSTTTNVSSPYSRTRPRARYLPPPSADQATAPDVPAGSGASQRHLYISSQHHNKMPITKHTATTSGADSAGRGVLIGLLSAFGSAGLVALLFAVIYFFRYTAQGRIFLDRMGRPGEYDDEQALLREEAEALETMDDLSRQEYLRAKAFCEANPPESVATDISLSQFLAIQEKGVSAWEFEAELEIANCFVEQRTEVEFFDSECSVQSNLPVPKQNEVYYWEAKIYDKPENTLISIGMTTKPYPMFRLPGYHKHSIAYLSTGHRRYNQPFSPTPYGIPYVQGDVIGVGYRPRTGTIFFTRNGKKLDDVVHGIKTLNLFPTIGANGPCTVHVNFGQLGFVFIEANVKKWGLAPMTGSLAPPPPYGSEQGSILLETGNSNVSQSDYFNNLNHHSESSTAQQRNRPNHQTHSRHASTPLPPTSPGPTRSPTDISLASFAINTNDSTAIQNLPQHLQQPTPYDIPQPRPHRHGTSSPPPDYASQTSDISSDDSTTEERTRRKRNVERERLLGDVPRSPTPAYRDVVRGRSGSEPVRGRDGR